MTTSTRKGVRLTLPGAPDHPHRVDALGVLVSPTEATVLDDDQVARAQELIDQGADLELVDVHVDPDASGDGSDGSTVVEPWPGYAGETAKAVIARLAEGDTQLAGAVIAFERQQSNPRRTVLDAAAARISELEG